jgi:hypothetical protein
VASIDTSTWQALGLLLTVVGLVLSLLVWRRRGATAGLRGVAWSLLPAAAGLTGTLKLVWEIGDDIASWAARLVFSPVVWAGIVLAGVSLMLFAVTAAMRARGMGRSPATGQAAGGEKQLPQQRGTTKATTKAEPAVQDKDMDDIEAILRKHGIT